ncbi:MAG: hypothetical protein EXS35_02480 [Pedosphaera sp.]|nr:hypothetical protein [Pedosphaera sp.]
MPKIRRQNLPPALLRHLVDRVESRKLSIEQLVRLADWLKTHPEVPGGKWFKRFPEVTVCGEGELIKTFLVVGQVPVGEEIH